MSDESAASEHVVPDWAVGTGVDTDMTGDPRPGNQSRDRFWMPKASEKKIVFLTDGNEALGVWEHQFRMGGKFTNWASCLEPIRVKCKFCQWALAHSNQFARSKILVFTVVDMDKYKDKAGKEHVNVRKFLCAKSRTAEILKRKYASQLEEGRGLKGAMFKVYRSNDDTSASVGTDFEYVKHIDLASLPESEPLDAIKFFAPNPSAVNAAIARVAAEAGEGEGGVSEGTETTVDY